MRSQGMAVRLAMKGRKQSTRWNIQLMIWRSGCKVNASEERRLEMVSR